MKVRVPEGQENTSLTIGKEYEVTNISHGGRSGDIINDNGCELFILLKEPCAHLSNLVWVIVDED